MKDHIEVLHLAELSGEKVQSGEKDYIYKPIVAPQSSSAGQSHIAVVEIMPGKHSFSYHYHETDEEAFYIISGQGAIRTPNIEYLVKQGDCILLPPGPQNAHSIRNTSESEKLVYIDFDTHNLPEITHFPDDGTVEVLGAFTSLEFKEEEGRAVQPRLKKGIRER